MIQMKALTTFRTAGLDRQKAGAEFQAPSKAIADKLEAEGNAERIKAGAAQKTAAKAGDADA